MKRIIFALSFLIVASFAFQGCEKEKVANDNQILNKTQTSTPNSKGSINPYDQYAVGIHLFYIELGKLCDNPYYANSEELFMQDALKFTSLINYPKLSQDALTDKDAAYLRDLLGSFCFLESPNAILSKAQEAETKVLNTVTDVNLRNTYLEIISLVKYFEYYKLVTYSLSWSERVDNCIGWQLYSIFSNPVLAAQFLAAAPVEFAAIAAACAWAATFQPNCHDCQMPHPEEAGTWIDYLD